MDHQGQIKIKSIFLNETSYFLFQNLIAGVKGFLKHYNKVILHRESKSIRLVRGPLGRYISLVKLINSIILNKLSILRNSNNL